MCTLLQYPQLFFAGHSQNGILFLEVHAASHGQYSGGSLSASSIGGGGDATWRSAMGHVGDPGDVE